MSTRHTKGLAIVGALLLLTAVGSLTAGSARAEQSDDSMKAAAETHMEHASMAAHHEMHAAMAKMDTNLTELVLAMQEATGDQKIEALAELVTELVGQHASMHLMLLQVQPQVLGHVAEHMASGMGSGVKQSIAECPMMKQPASSHKDHSDPEDHNNEDLSARGSEG